jgi:hypothetical protein
VQFARDETALGLLHLDEAQDIALSAALAGSSAVRSAAVLSSSCARRRSASAR